MQSRLLEGTLTNKMAIEKLEQLVNGGAASAAPPLGPALGPMGVNIGEVIKVINEKTAAFKGMQVPVIIEVDTETKAFEISVGTPPASALIKKEANITKGSGSPEQQKVADLKIEQIIKISQMKNDDLLGSTPQKRVKEIIGTCVSMGVLVEGVNAHDACKLVDEGKFDDKINSGKTELTDAELKELDEEKKKFEAEMKVRKTAWEAEAKELAAQHKKLGDYRKAAMAAGIPEEVFKNFGPKE